MRETPLAKGLNTFDPATALNQLYDFMTKSTAGQKSPDYEFVHDMNSKLADGEDFSEQELIRIQRAHSTRFGR